MIGGMVERVRCVLKADRAFVCYLLFRVLFIKPRKDRRVALKHFKTPKLLFLGGWWKEDSSVDSITEVYHTVKTRYSLLWHSSLLLTHS